MILNINCTTLDPTSLGIDFLCVDPPYGKHVHDRMTSCAQKGSRKGVRKRDAGFDPLSDELRDYIAEASKACARWSAIYCDIQGNALWEGVIGRHVRTVPAVDLGETTGGAVGTLPWIRWTSPQQSGDRPPSGCELIVLGHAPGSMRWRGPGNLIVLDHKCLRGLEKHPTEKPLDQALDLVSWFTDPGERVFDPCAGSGTTALACHLLGREFLGCELDERWASFANARIDGASKGFYHKRDRDRIDRWLNSVSVRSGLGEWPATSKRETPQIPDMFKQLIKGKIEGT